MAYTTDKDKMLSTAREVERNEDIPSGYFEINLSTHGKVGAPASFHIRNFTTEDLMDLAITDQEELPSQVIKKLQDLIWEKDCDIKKFHEREVIETLFIIYRDYYSDKLPGVKWELTEEDKEKIAKDSGGDGTDEYKRKMWAYDNDKWKPIWDIDLNSFDFYEVPDDFKTTAEVKKPSGFTFEYTLPKYGDVLTLKEFIKVYFRESDKRFAHTKEQVTNKNQMKQAFFEGKSMDDGSRIYIPESEYEEYKEYQKEKVVFSTKAMKALHVKSINGEDVSNLPLEKKMELVENPEFDHASFRQVSAVLDKLEFGIKPQTTGFDPILRKKVNVDYSFSVFALIQALRDNDSDKTVITLK